MLAWIILLACIGCVASQSLSESISIYWLNITGFWFSGTYSCYFFARNFCLIARWITALKYSIQIRLQQANDEQIIWNCIISSHLYRFWTHYPNGSSMWNACCVKVHLWNTNVHNLAYYALVASHKIWPESCHTTCQINLQNSLSKYKSPFTCFSIVWLNFNDFDRLHGHCVSLLIEHTLQSNRYMCVCVCEWRMT